MIRSKLRYPLQPGAPGIRDMAGGVYGRRSLCRRAGFTLVEMIVAAVLLFVGVVATLVCISSATRSTSIASEYTNAALLAQKHFSELQAQPDQITSGDQQGEFGEENPGFRWQQTSEATDIQGLLKVTLIVDWPSGGTRRIAQFATYMQQPPTTTQ